MYSGVLPPSLNQRWYFFSCNCNILNFELVLFPFTGLEVASNRTGYSVQSWWWWRRSQRRRMPPLRSRSRTSTSSLTRSSRTSRRLSRSSQSRRRPTRRGRRTRRKWASRWRAAPEKHWRVVFFPQARWVGKFYNSNFEIYWIKIVSSLKLCGGAKSLKLSHQLCNGELSLTEEEKRTLVSEGIPYSIFGILVFLAIPTLFLVSKVLSIRMFCFFA